MRWRPILLAIALLSAVLGACGTTRHTVSRGPVRAGGVSDSPAQAVRRGGAAYSSHDGYLVYDGDTDKDDSARVRPSEDDDRDLMMEYPTTITGAQRRGIVKLVEDFYSAAQQGQSARVCSMLTPTLAEGLPAPASSTTTRGRSGCERAVTPFLEAERAQLRADEPASMTILTVRASGDVGFALVGFRHASERELPLERDSNAWRVASLEDRPVP